MNAAGAGGVAAANRYDLGAPGAAIPPNQLGAGEIYNIVDDEPLLATQALDLIAASVGAKPPRRLLPVGPARVKHFFNGGTGASNHKARSALEWTPRYKSLVEGFRTEDLAGLATGE